jgi:hypothetical protein
MNRDFSPKPAYIAYSTMTRILKGMKFIKTLPMPEGIFAGEFEDEKDPDTKAIAVWSPSADRSVEIEISSDKATLINTIGETSELKDLTKETRRFVNVQLKKNSPVYLR